MHRLSLLEQHIEASACAAKSSFSVTDNRTGTRFRLRICSGKQYELQVKNGAINSKELENIKDENGKVTRYYDPGYMNTVNCVRLRAPSQSPLDLEGQLYQR